MEKKNIIEFLLLPHKYCKYYSFEFDLIPQNYIVLQGTPRWITVGLCEAEIYINISV